MKHARQVGWSLIVVLASCTQSHDGVQKLASDDCHTCHVSDYMGTSQVAGVDPAVPDHLANASIYGTECAECHVTTTWYSHPEKLFNIQSASHTAIECNSCHTNSDDNAGDAHGANTLCTKCHPATEPFAMGNMTTGHSDVAAFSYTTPAPGFNTNNFCLSCHPNGREKPHDDTIFPSHHGNARGCESCHDRSKSSDAMGKNADCRRCHQGAHHGEVTSPAGCITASCHMGGGHGDD
jgi:hypothetical protein